MPGFAEFNNSKLNQYGNLSLGGSGYDDGKGNATYGYAKDDVWINVSAADLIGDTLPVLTYATGDIPKRTLVASTTHKLIIPLEGGMQRSFVAGTGRSANPHGLLVKSVAIAYRVNTTTITSATIALRNYRLVAAADLPTVVAPAGAVAGNTLTAAANVYLMTFTPTAEAFITTVDTATDALVTIVIPGSSTVDILGASWRLAVALY